MSLFRNPSKFDADNMRLLNLHYCINDFNALYQKLGKMKLQYINDNNVEWRILFEHLKLVNQSLQTINAEKIV